MYQNKILSIHLLFSVLHFTNFIFIFYIIFLTYCTVSNFTEAFYDLFNNLALALNLQIYCTAPNCTKPNLSKIILPISLLL